MKDGFSPSEEDRQTKENEFKFKTMDNSVYSEAVGEVLTSPVPISTTDQIIHEGFLQSPDTSPEHVVILAEGIPSWLAAADAWGSYHGCGCLAAVSVITCARAP